MKKHHIQYDSPIDALVAVTKQLHTYEMKYSLETEDFYDQFRKGERGDSRDFIEWANAYQHYLALHQELEQRLTHVA